MAYISEQDLQKATTGLVDQKVKELIEKKIRSQFKFLPISIFENKRYYLDREINTAIDNTVKELSIIISQNLNSKEVDVRKIKSFQRNEYGVALFHTENILRYVDDVLSKYKF